MISEMTDEEKEEVRNDFFNLNQAQFSSKYNSTMWNEARYTFWHKRKYKQDYTLEEQQEKARQDNARIELERTISERNRILREKFYLTDKEIKDLLVKEGWAYSELLNGEVINGEYIPKKLILIYK